MKIINVGHIRLNKLLIKLISCFFSFFNMATGKFKIHMAHVDICWTVLFQENFLKILRAYLPMDDPESVPD